MLKRNKKNKIQIPEYKQYGKLRLLSFFIIGLIGVGLIGGIIFVYSNIYSAINQTQAVLMLNTNLSIKTINFTQYDKVDKLWKEKYSDEEMVLTRDPFSAVAEATKTEEEIKIE